MEQTLYSQGILFFGSSHEARVKLSLQNKTRNSNYKAMSRPIGHYFVSVCPRVPCHRFRAAEKTPAGSGHRFTSLVTRCLSLKSIVYIFWSKLDFDKITFPKGHGCDEINQSWVEFFCSADCADGPLEPKRLFYGLNVSSPAIKLFHDINKLPLHFFVFSLIQL